jgi:phosphoribosylanthranilate isomerase
MSVIVEICGITNLADGMAAVEAGADALGFVFCESSPRCLSIPAAARIVPQLPPSTVKVAVFVNADEELVLQVIRECGVNMLQFHGDETPEYCLQFGVLSIKAFRIRNQDSLKDLTKYPTDAWLLDSYVADKLGGTGLTFNWTLARQARQFGRPIFLAGGLTPANIGEAVRLVEPYAVDVSSGVEARPGVKDHAKLEAFIRGAKAALP